MAFTALALTARPHALPWLIFCAQPTVTPLVYACKNLLPLEAIRAYDKRVRFLSTLELGNLLETKKANGKASHIAHRLMNVDLGILDEMGYLPFTQ